MADPWAWQKYSKRRGVSNGMSLGTGGGGNIGIADYLSENFDNLGGGSLTPQQELTATQDAIRGGAAMKSPETSVTRTDPDFMRSITQAPDGSNYLPEKPSEIPPMLARQITDPTPPAPASGSGINPQMLVRPQGDAQSRGSNLANTMPRREDFRKNEGIAKFLEDRAAKDLQSGMGSVFKNNVRSSASQDIQLAQYYRGLDNAAHQESLNQYFIQNPDQHEEWKRRTMIDKKIIPRSAPVNAIDPRTKNLVGIDEYGGKKVYEGVMPQNAYEIGAVGDRMAADDARKAAEAKLDREFKNTASVRDFTSDMARTAAMNAATELRGRGLDIPKNVGVEYLQDEDDKAAKKYGPPGSAGYNSELVRRGYQFVPVDGSENPEKKLVRYRSLSAAGGPAPASAPAAAPAAGAKGAAPAPAAKGDATRGGRAKVTPVG